MDKEQIEKAAVQYAQTFIESSITAYKSFKVGADWRINSVWHNASEEPIAERGRWLAFCGGIKVFIGEEWRGGFSWEEYASMLGIITWAYIEDLLPSKKGEQVMNYDITMCRCACSRARTCHRWLQFQRYLKDKNPNKPKQILVHSAADGQIDDKCTIYWKEEGGHNENNQIQRKEQTHRRMGVR